MNLFILGNGFDLMAGATTNIDDYLRYKDKALSNICSDVTEKISKLKVKPKGAIYNPFNDYFYITYDETSQEDTKVDFWTVLLLYNHYKVDSKRSSWSDVESLIYEVISLVTEQKFNSASNFDGMLTADDSNFIESLLLNHGCHTELEGRNTKVYTEKILDLLFEDLIQFDLNFANYLSYLEESHSDGFSIQKNVYEKKANFWRVNSRQPVFTLKPTDLILNFNYTNSRRDTFKRNSADEFDLSNEINIHGNYVNARQSISNFNKNTVPLIFGFDHSLLKSYDSYYVNRFTKTNQLLELDRRNNTTSASSLFNLEINNIYFMGHSLGSADWAYFFAIFDFLNLHSNHNLKLHFLYSIEYATLKDNGDFLAKYQNAAFSLLGNYGKKLSNINNGDYLLTKLSLEHRIDFLPVDSQHR